MIFNVDMMFSSPENMKFGNSLQIYLDGVEQNRVVAFDTEVGYIDKYLENTKNIPTVSICRLFGKVTYRVKDGN